MHGKPEAEQQDILVHKQLVSLGYKELDWDSVKKAANRADRYVAGELWREDHEYQLAIDTWRQANTAKFRELVAVFPALKDIVDHAVLRPGPSADAVVMDMRLPRAADATLLAGVLSTPSARGRSNLKMVLDHNWEAKHTLVPEKCEGTGG